METAILCQNASKGDWLQPAAKLAELVKLSHIPPAYPDQAMMEVCIFVTALHC
jgi:hypothetical protein